ncbi:MAG: PqqD family protein [Pseudomonadota bacterium]
MPGKKTKNKSEKTKSRAGKAAVKKAGKTPARKKKPAARAAKKGKASITAGTRVRKHANVASRTIDGREVVIVPAARRLQTFNEVATRIWALCDGRSIGEIAEVIKGEYEVGGRTALKDAKDFVSLILRKGMLEIL